MGNILPNPLTLPETACYKDSQGSELCSPTVLRLVIMCHAQWICCQFVVTFQSCYRGNLIFGLSSYSCAIIANKNNSSEDTCLDMYFLPPL